MTRKTRNNSLFVLVAAGIASSSALAADLDTSFEPPDGTVGTFTLGASPNTVTFADGEAKTIGSPPLYRPGGAYSWMIDVGNTGTITFETAAGSVDLWFRDQTASTNSILTVFDDAGAVIQTFNGTSASFAPVSITRNPATQTPIGKITLQNNGGTGDGYAVIDDFSFTASVAATCTTDPDCDDGDACNGAESCTGGTCIAGTALSCNDANPCTNDSCNASTGCVNTADATNTCSDGDVCTENDACVAGVCAGTAIVGCSSAPSVDTDGDGTPDASDGCPNDPEKVEPGNCGCGMPDFNGDGSANCPAEPPPGAVPAVTMTATPLSGASPLTVTFNGNAQSPFGIDLAATEWNFGDGQRSFGVTAVTHTYTAPPGETVSFTARLIMTDVDRRRGSAEAEIRVVGDSAANPNDTSGVGGVAIIITEADSVDTTVSEGTSPLDVVLAVATDTLKSATIDSVTWDLGDGNFANSFSVTHRYVVEGTGPQTFVIVATVQLRSAAGTPLTRFADRFLTVQPGVPMTDTPDASLPGTTPFGEGGSASFLCGALGMIPLALTLAGMSLLRGTRRRRLPG